MHTRNVTIQDIDNIVNIHCSAFKDFFLTSLGPDFLKFYYTSFVNSQETVIICAECDGEILGFAASSQKSKGFNSRLIKTNFIGFCWLALKLFFVSPKSLLRLGRNLAKKSKYVEDCEDYAELYSIGVIKNVQGKGIGKLLLMECEKKLKDLGIEKISLTTDFYNNDSAIGFYRSMGYEVLYEFIAYPNRKMYRFIKRI